MNYSDLNIVVLGLGKSGISAIDFLYNKCSNIIAVDSKKEVSGLDKYKNVEFILGKNTSEPLKNADLVVVSPGISPTYPGLKDKINEGKVTTEIEIARNLINSKVITITGTNGKTTTAHLISHLLKTANKTVCLAGNVGEPLLNKIDEANSSDFTVIEISSFQLHYSKEFKSNVCVWLNLTDDHLDWHENIQEYADDKAKLIRNLKENDYFVHNYDDKVVREYTSFTKASLLPYSTNKKDWDNGAYLNDDNIAFGFEGKMYGFLKDNLKIKGKHNIENVLAAGLAVLAAGISFDSLERGLGDFSGLSHRIEFVREKDGIKYFNDSKGTNVGAVVAAIKGFDEDIILIAGGQEKNTKWNDLVEASKGKVKHVVLIGNASKSLEKVFKDIIPVSLASSMDEAVSKACNESKSGDVVLLSPACASFDMFKNYEDRGNKFKSAVGKL